MRLLPKLISIIAVSLLAACATTRSPQADEVTRAAVMQRVIELLHRYEQNDQAGVVAMLDKNQVTILGSAISEKITAPAQL
jgi:predicted lipoprotein